MITQPITVIEANNPKSLYIHIPFCSNICSYCDFCKFYYNEKLVDDYLSNLNLEIINNYQHEVIETLYIGGGTPSSLSLSNLKKLFAIIDKINFSSDLEFTFECNIMDLTDEKLLFLQKNKVNRLSIGVESFQDEILTFLERKYSQENIIERVKIAQKYFDNINVDIMYAVPGETISNLINDLEMFIKLDIKHISTYSLIIEEHTKLFINKVNYIDEDIDKNMYDLICDKLKENDYIHYEISNFCKEGYESRHNLTYWKNNKYYGFGLSASGYVGNIRYTNTKNLTKYLSGEFAKETEIITKKIDASNYAILALRTKYGINKQKFCELYGCDFIDWFEVQDLVNDNILLDNGNCYVINYKYWYVSNEILTRFI